MNEYWVRTQQVLLGQIEENENTIKSYQDSIANLLKDNEGLRSCLEDLKKLE